MYKAKKILPENSSLLNLIKRCLDNTPQKRSCAKCLVEKFEEIGNFVENTFFSVILGKFPADAALQPNNGAAGTTSLNRADSSSFSSSASGLDIN